MKHLRLSVSRNAAVTMVNVKITGASHGCEQVVCRVKPRIQ